jgi:hemolysin III
MPKPGLTDQLAADIKPRLRGWLHAATVPLALIGGVLLIVFAPTTLGKVGASVYLACSLLLFGNSAVYHRGAWGPKVKAVLRRVDHANIFLFIAATYTPLTLLLLEGRSRTILLVLIWSAAVVGVLFRVFWLGAPRWSYVVLYITMGWAAVGWLGQFWAAGGPLVVALIGAGGLLYTVGALAYAFKRPNPFPAWYGFHEIFHTCTILAAFCHFAAIALATFK